MKLPEVNKLTLVTNAVAVIVVVLCVSFFCQGSECPPESRKRFYPSFAGPSSFVDCLNGTAFRNYSCGGLVFKPRNSDRDTSPLCVSSSTKYGTAAFDCSSNGNGSYSGDPTLYVACQNGAPTDLFECPIGQYFIDDESQCNYSCAVQYKIGSFATADGYYTCVFDYVTLRWNLTTHTCPENETFDETYEFCLSTPDTPVNG